MNFSYTQSYLQERVDARIQRKIGMLIDPMETMNEAVRELMTKVDIKTSRRCVPLVPNLMSGITEYVCPVDFDSSAIIDVPGQSQQNGEWYLVPIEEFRRMLRRDMIAIHDFNGIRTINLVANQTDVTDVVSPVSTVNEGNGAGWTAVGDAVNVKTDTFDWIRNTGSVSFDLGPGTVDFAGIENTALAPFDLTNFLGSGAFEFLYAKITSITGVSSFEVRMGQDSANYFSITTTVRNDGTAFQNGWNLLQYPIVTYATVGVPALSGCTYVQLRMNKQTAKGNEIGYHFNYLVIKQGKYSNLEYYSSFGWVDPVTGSYKDNATTPEDLLVANSDEIGLFIKQGKICASREIDVPQSEINNLEADLRTDIQKYGMDNPSEAKIMSNEYHSYRGTDRLDPGYGSFGYYNGDRRY